MTPGGHFWPQGYHLKKLGRGPLGDASYQYQNIKALGLVVSEKKIFKVFILKIYI